MTKQTFSNLREALKELIRIDDDASIADRFADDGDVWKSEELENVLEFIRSYLETTSEK